MLPRPRKWRRVCCLPQSSRFGPINAPADTDKPVVMTVDEYETIRLIDLQGFTQEGCSEQMNIARTTVQRIYNDARKKLADSLVNGRLLVIKGGDFKLCDGLEKSCGCGGCRRHRHGGFSTSRESEEGK